MNKLHNKHGSLPIATVSVLAEDAKNATDIMFIHMSWGGTWAFDYYLDFFAERGYNAHALDLRGHGESGGTVEGATMQDYVDDVHAAVTGLELDNPVIVGHSMGGLVALDYSAQHGSKATVAMDSSPPIEVQKESKEKEYKPAYTPADSGMPSNPIKVMSALPDIAIFPWRLAKLKRSLGVESGVARSDRKRGVSVPKEEIPQPLLFIGGEKGTSLPFGIGIEKARKEAEYYDAPVVEIKGATHPGILIGWHWKGAAREILNWLEEM